MKNLIVLLFVFAFLNCYAQKKAIDNYPNVAIFKIDDKTGEEVRTFGDESVLFKNSFVKLVNATPLAKQLTSKASSLMGSKNMLIKQADPKVTDGYQLTYQNNFADELTIIYYFLYNFKKNALYFYNEGTHKWQPVKIEKNNMKT